MRYHIGLYVLIGIIGLASVCSAASTPAAPSGASTTAAPAMSIPAMPAFPYEAEITGDDVYVRSGPSTAYYECGKLYKGDKVKIVASQNGVWSQIQPPKGSFSWVSMQYVKPDTTDSTVGIITNDDVRVWAGSDRIRPEASTTLQGKLNKGDKVKLLGEQLNNYYKIAVPSLPDAYFWISTQFTKPISAESPVALTTSLAGANKTSPSAGGVTANVTSDSNAVAPAVESHEPTLLDKYYDLQKQLDAERVKPINDQNYSEIKKGLQELVDNKGAKNIKDAEKASKYAKLILDRIEGFELALGVDKVIKSQNDDLKQITEKIGQDHAQKLEQIQNLGKYAVIGKLQNWLQFGSGYYRIIGESGQTICTAAPSGRAVGRDLTSLIGKKVGLVGSIEPNTQTSGATVRFSDIVSLD
jgi:uncharacterized protein YgiM (DUF1202 family)